MDRELYEYSLEELWQLFPIELKEYNINYPNMYFEESSNLSNILNGNVSSINHIGSTAIENILSKPIIDILVELIPNVEIESILNELIKNGWLVMSKTETPHLRVSLNKGYTVNGFSNKVFHLHLRQIGDNDELFFRDYLINNPLIAKEYSKLKLNLASEYKYNRDAYTNSKTEFIQKYTEIAKFEYTKKA